MGILFDVLFVSYSIIYQRYLEEENKNVPRYVSLSSKVKRDIMISLVNVES